MALATATSDMRLGRSSRASATSMGSVENTSISSAPYPRTLSARMADATDCGSPKSAVRTILVLPNGDRRKELAEDQVEHGHGRESRCRDRDLHPCRLIETSGRGEARV